MINLIAAMSKNRVIGNNNSLIWKLPADMKRFKEMTQNTTVVMGRKTFESIGKPLPNRRNIIITKSDSYEADGCEIVNSLNEALLLCNNDCFIIGGGEIYKQSMSIADRIYLTIIHEDFEGDTYFPEISNDWIKTNRQDNDPDDKNKYKYSFIDYERYTF